MAEEPQVIQIIRLIAEVFWILLQINIEIVKSVYRCIIPPEPKDVSEDIVLITGAGHGIGRNLALRFARLGSVVVCVDINPAGNQETVDMIKQENGKAFKYECDVTNRTAVMELGEKVKKEIGDVTILINNAGIMPTKPILKHSEKEIRAIMDINVNANFWMIQAFLPAMIENNNGHIVALSSVVGLTGARNVVPYSGSKFAVKGYMEALGMELHRDPRGTNGIKLTTIYPYMVNTGLCKKPNIRFQNLMPLVDPNDAADQIVDAVRREYTEVSIPSYLYYFNKYVLRVLPGSCLKTMLDFLDAGVEEIE